MKLEIEIDSKFENSKYLTRACVYESLDRIKNEISKGKRGGGFEHVNHGYQVMWDLYSDEGDENENI